MNLYPLQSSAHFLCLLFGSEAEAKHLSLSCLATLVSFHCCQVLTLATGQFTTRKHTSPLLISFYFHQTAKFQTFTFARFSMQFLRAHKPWLWH